MKMTEEQRVSIINANAGKVVESLLEAFENEHSMKMSSLPTHMQGW